MPSGLGKSYWTRASGWLLWGITGVLRHLPAGDPEFRGFAADLNRLASGIARVQDVLQALESFEAPSAGSAAGKSNGGRAGTPAGVGAGAPRTGATRLGGKHGDATPPD